MKVKSVLDQKGTFVATIRPEATVVELCALLSKHNIGAVVVSSDGKEVAGIVSERDVVRSLAKDAEAMLTKRVADLMTEIVASCEPENNTDDLMVTMTARRVRHVPVLQNSELVGIVSIGDVVRVTMQELEDEKATLLGYITS